MTTARDTRPPPSAPRDAAYANTSDAGLRELLALAVTRLELHLDESVEREAALRRNTEALREMRGELADTAGAFLTLAKRVATVDERVRTLCEVHDAGFREMREDFASMRENVVLRQRQTADEVAALQGTVDAVGQQSHDRDIELGSRLGRLETDIGSWPIPAIGDKPARPGTGALGRLDTLWADLTQRTKGNALALTGGAAAGVPVALALYKLVEFLIALAKGG